MGDPHAVAFSGAVLIGGDSRRMGADKSALAVGGVPMSQRVADAARSAGADPVVLIGRGGAPLAREARRAEVIADGWPGEGPLGGILTALAWTPVPLVLVVACDLPFLDGSTIGRLVAGARRGPCAVTVAVADRRQPLCAVWNAPRCREVVGDAFAAGERSVHRVLERLAVLDVDVAPRAVINVNTPEVLAQVRGEAAGPVLAAHDEAGAPSVQSMPIDEITVHELAARLAEGALLFDVREIAEYAEAHAPGAVLVPLSQLIDRVDEFPTEGEVLLICRSGGRSMRACQFLVERGVRAVNIAGGTGAWIDAGFEVVTGLEPT